jgi:hypothetical protein
MTYQFRSLEKSKSNNSRGENSNEDDTDDKESEGLKGYIYAAIVMSIILVLLFSWFLIKGSPWEGI